MVPPVDDVKNWMHMFRWIVKLIRDEYEVEEAILVRTAALETDCGLMIEQVETVLGTIAQCFGVSFPPGTLDEVLKLEELCKQPPFLSDAFAERCRSVNAACG